MPGNRGRLARAGRTRPGRCPGRSRVTRSAGTPFSSTTTCLTGSPRAMTCGGVLEDLAARPRGRTGRPVRGPGGRARPRRPGASGSRRPSASRCGGRPDRRGSPRRNAGRGPGRTGTPRAIRFRPRTAEPAGGWDGVDRRALEILAPCCASPVAGRSRRWATTTSTPRGLRARRILIGSIAVPSYSPGIGNDVTIKNAHRSLAPSFMGSCTSPKIVARCPPRKPQFRTNPPSGPVPVRRRMDDADRLAAMALGVAEGAAHAAVEGLDGGVENAPGGVEVAGPEGIGVARQAGAGIGQSLGAEHPAERDGDLVRLERLVVPVAAGRAVVRPAARTAGPDRPTRSRA